MRNHLIAALTVCLATLGLTAGLFAFPAQADNSYGAHSVEDLQALGYRVGLRVDLSISQCAFLYVLSDGDVTFPDLHEPVIENNVDPNHPECPPTPPDVIQQRIDDLVAAYPPVPPTTTTAAPDAPAAPAAPAAPSGTPASPGGTTTVTVTVTDPTVQAQIDALNAKLDALANPTVDARLSALEQRQAVNDARIATLEQRAGIIVPEAKNEPPFTNPV